MSDLFRFLGSSRRRVDRVCQSVQSVIQLTLIAVCVAVMAAAQTRTGKMLFVGLFVLAFGRVIR